MTQVTNKLQSLIFGDRSTFILTIDYNDYNDIVNQEKIIKLLHKMESKGYAPTNPCVLFNMNKETFNLFKKDFTALVQNSTKEGRVIRTTFFDNSYPTKYTSEEWTAIMAQYAITYGWKEQYTEITRGNAEDVLQAYVAKFTDKKINLTKKVKIKKFSIGTSQRHLPEIIKNIISSKAVLRTQQIAVLKECPKSVLIQSSNGTRVPIKETLVLLVKLLRDQKIPFPLLQTAQDVLRYIVSVHAETALEGQLNKTLLKDCKIHIPTADRKMLLNNLEMIAGKRNNGSQFLCEDMFSYEAYWKIINKYLQYEQYSKARIKYPLYTGAIDLLYENNRSWTFNGRYSAAKEEMDYEKAIEIAAERPGFMLRNMMEFIRMATGVKMPKKKDIGTLTKVNYTPKPANNPFANKLAGKKVKVKTPKIKPDSVITDASAFFDSDVFSNICKNKMNTKLAFQLIEQIEEPRNNKPQNTRVVQDITVHYEVPVPALDKKMKKIVLKQLNKAIKHKLRSKNEYIKSIFIDDDVAEYSLQYSGRDSTELSYSGEFMAKNSIIPFSELGKKNPIIRLGVMWRSKPNHPQSIDIDHNVTLIGGSRGETSVYYGNKTYTDSKGIVAASSSGDITSCGSSTSAFSTEIVDLDVARLKADGITNLYNSFINYHGIMSIGSLECYTFMQIMSKTKITTGENRTRVKVDLAKTDYAIQIDPNNIDQTGSYIGLHFNLVDETVEVLAIPIKNSGIGYSNVKTNATSFYKAIEGRTQSYLLGDALELAFSKKQRVTSPELAEVIITRKDADNIETSEDALILHPGKDGELINEYLFT